MIFYVSNIVSFLSQLVKPAAIANPEHPVNVARRRAAELGPGSIFADQFENMANMCVLVSPLYINRL